MQHISKIKLDSQNMNIVVDLVSDNIVRKLISKSKHAHEYKDKIFDFEKVYFFKYQLNTVICKETLKLFYNELNNKITEIEEKLKHINPEYKKVLKEKRLKELRMLFESKSLTELDLRAIPLLLRCLGTDCNNKVLFMIDNEIYIRNRIGDKTSKSYLSEIKIVEENNKLKYELDRLKEEIEEKEQALIKLEQVNEQLKLELYFDYKEIGYYDELSQEDFGKIVEDLGKHNSKIKDKFKDLVMEFEESGDHTDDKLYELWMNWTEDEVTIMDRVLKKSMYAEKICRSDVSDLEEMSNNLKNRHLLSRLVLHLIYRRMSSQCWEEVLG